MPTSATTFPKVIMAATTNIGNVRKENEDAFYFSEAKRFMVTCDGMGGHEKGAAASKMGCGTLRDVLFAPQSLRGLTIRNKTFDAVRASQDVKQGLPEQATRLIAATRLANRRILATCLGNKHMTGMGTTVVAVSFLKSHAIIIHVGDSRLYRLRHGELSPLTTDHSWLNELLEDNEISEKEANAFKKKNVLTRALGISPTVRIDLQITETEPRDLFLVCTDGLYNALSDDLIASILSANHDSLQDKAENLVNRAKLMDGSDNITAGLVQVVSTSGDNSEVAGEFMTVPVEPAGISDYLDQTVRHIYPTKPASTVNRRRRTGIVAAMAIVAVLVALVLYHTSEAQRSRPAAAETALFERGNRRSETRLQKVSDAANAGFLALVQVSDRQTLNALEDSHGVRVLDSVSRLRSGARISAGSYTWALADDNETILYKNEHIFLQPLPDKPQSRGDGGRSGAASEFPGNQGLVFLVGAFDSPVYRDASIYVNNARYGALSRFKDGGLRLSSGTYEIKIVDRRKKVLKKKSGVELARGETIALEF